jgi:hypothetical protein
MGVLGRHFRIHVLRYMYSKGLLGATVVQTKILERANVPVFLSGLGDEIPARTLTWGYLVIASAMVMERTLRFVPASCFRICVTFLNPKCPLCAIYPPICSSAPFQPRRGRVLVLASDGTRMMILGESTTLLVGCHPPGAAGLGTSRPI